MSSASPTRPDIAMPEGGAVVARDGIPQAVVRMTAATPP
jgi:hypothetical protein